jgi:hypothetical protein
MKLLPMRSGHAQLMKGGSSDECSGGLPERQQPAGQLQKDLGTRFNQ